MIAGVDVIPLALAVPITERENDIPFPPGIPERDDPCSPAQGAAAGVRFPGGSIHVVGHAAAQALWARDSEGASLSDCAFVWQNGDEDLYLHGSYLVGILWVTSLAVRNAACVKTGQRQLT